MEKRLQGGIEIDLGELIRGALQNQDFQHTTPISDLDLEHLMSLLKAWPFIQGAQEIRRTRELIDFMLIARLINITTRKMLQRFHEIIMLAYASAHGDMVH